MRNIAFEPFTPAHRNLLYDIFRDIHPELTSIVGLDEDQMEGMLRLQFDIRQKQLGQLYPEAERSIILLDGVPVGYVSTDFGSDIRIIEVGLYEKYRGNGIGSYVVRNIIEKADSLGKNISLQVLWCNTAAYQFYKKMGFSQVNDNGVTYEMVYRCNTSHKVEQPG